MPKSAYIHIPFCAYKCDFCDFAAFSGVDHLAQPYCAVVVDEIEKRLSKQPNEEALSAVFYGGGTPGYISADQLALIHKTIERCVGLKPDAEISMETTPHSITVDKAKRWLALGINRLSIGVQSFNDLELKAAGRDHTSSEALRGIERALAAGFANVSIDLMYGLPEQTLSSWEQSLSIALSLNVQHLSAYGLTIAAASPLLSRYPRDCAAYPAEDDFVELYRLLIEKCENAGFAQYEISNFSRPGCESRHNMTYWQNSEYLAFGVSAHRYVQGVRSSNLRALKRYMRDCLADETYEVIDNATRAREAVMLGLRTRRGIEIAQYEREYGVNLAQALWQKATTLIDEGFLQLDEGWMRLTQKGVLVSNTVLSELI